MRLSSLMMSKSQLWLSPSNSLISCGAACRVENILYVRKIFQWLEIILFTSRFVSHFSEPRVRSVDGRLWADSAASRLPELCEV